MSEIVDKQGYTWSKDDKGLWVFKHTPALAKSESRETKYSEPPPYPTVYTLEETYKDAFNKILSTSIKGIGKIINDSIK